MLVPNDFVLDVHDFCAIILDAYVRIKPPFPFLQLHEVNKGDSPIQSFIEEQLHREWRNYRDQPRVAHVLCSS